jgi:hypothetical protein
MEVSKLGLFDGKTDCYKCGREIEKKSAEKRFGKFFCNKEEAEEFVGQVEKQKAHTPEQRSGGGCC